MSSISATSSSTAGYFAGGVYMNKVISASDTTSNISDAALSVARYYLAASSARDNALPQPTVTLPNNA